MSIDQAENFGSLNSLHQRHFQKVTQDQGGPGRNGPKEITSEQFEALRERIAAETGNDEMAVDFAAIDKDASDGVSRQEIQKYLHQAFKTPTDDDAAETPPPSAPPLDPVNLSVLIDQQSITPEDLQPVFAKFDADGSETLNQEELTELHSAISPLIEETETFWSQDVETLLGTLDADGNREVVADELIAALQSQLTEDAVEPEGEVSDNIAPEDEQAV